MRKKLVVGNWKMNASLAGNAALVDDLLAGWSGAEAVDVAVCPPFPYLAQVGGLLAGSSVQLGAQDVSADAPGAHTGDVSAGMLADLGCRYVIVGHSERRADHGESDALIAAKVLRVLSAGLRPILCVGETLAEHDAGQAATVVARQLAAVLDVCADAGFLQQGVVAYEPVWAIGTGRSASGEYAQQIHAGLRAEVAARDAGAAAAMPILYGGSVKPATAAELFAQPDIDGGLIGGAALVGADFVAICRAAAR